MKIFNPTVRLFSVIVFLLCLTPLSYAGLYKGVDEQGNVVYSDTPFKSATEFTPPPVSVIDKTKIKKKYIPEQTDEPKEEKLKVFQYTVFKITSPKNEETIWNQANAQVSLLLKPALNTTQNHSITLLLNGKSKIRKSNNLSMSLGRLDRGRHTVQAVVNDGKGKVLIKTKSIAINIKHGVKKKLKPIINNPTTP